jgi:large subunit ribosomal protein L20
MRVKRGIVGRRRHNKVLTLSAGFKGRRNNVFKFAKDAVDRSLENQYIGRKLRKRDFRRLWITRLNAAARLNGLSYSKLINGLNLANITLDRKTLADLAIQDPAGFAAVAEKAKAALA